MERISNEATRSSWTTGKSSRLHLYLDKILKKNKKTQASYLESLNHLAYLLYLDGQEKMAKKLLESVIQVPFEGNYNTWTFVDSSLVLLAYLESEMERRLLYLPDLLKIHLFITESTCEETDIQAKIEENMEILKKYIKEHEIYSLFPFKG